MGYGTPKNRHSRASCSNPGYNSTSFCSHLLSALRRPSKKPFWNERYNVRRGSGGVAYVRLGWVVR